MTLLLTTRTDGRSLACRLTMSVTLATETAERIRSVPLDRNHREANFDMRRKNWGFASQDKRIRRLLMTVTADQDVPHSTDSLGLQLMKDLVFVAFANVTTTNNAST